MMYIYYGSEFRLSSFPSFYEADTNRRNFDTNWPTMTNVSKVSQVIYYFIIYFIYDLKYRLRKGRKFSQT